MQPHLSAAMCCHMTHSETTPFWIAHSFDQILVFLDAAQAEFQLSILIPFVATLVCNACVSLAFPYDHSLFLIFSLGPLAAQELSPFQVVLCRFVATPGIQWREIRIAHAKESAPRASLCIFGEAARLYAAAESSRPGVFFPDFLPTGYMCTVSWHNP